MIVKMAGFVGFAVWSAFQLSAVDAAVSTAGKALEQAAYVGQLKQSTRCQQAKAFGLTELRARGLTISDCS